METVQTIHFGGSPEPVQAIPQRDNKQFDSVLLTYSPVLYRIALRKLGNAEDAEDALQDALLSAFKNMHKFRGEARFSTWLGSIVLNSARVQLRRRLSHNLVSLDQHDGNREEGNPIWAERLEDGSPNAEESLRRSETRETLERIVEELPAVLRVAFRLRVFEGLTTSEAAAALGVPKGTLKARFFRARIKVTALVRQAINSASAPERPYRQPALVHEPERISNRLEQGPRPKPNRPTPLGFGETLGSPASLSTMNTVVAPVEILRLPHLGAGRVQGSLALPRLNPQPYFAPTMIAQEVIPADRSESADSESSR